MNGVLATLQRLSATLWLHDGFGPAPGAPAATPMFFANTEDARHYLNFWKTDAAALSALRYALYRSQPAPSVYAMGDDQVIRRLAATLADGSVVLTHSHEAALSGGWPLIAAPPVPAPTSSTLINLNALPDRPPVPPLLPLLEELQIEGAEVLPEIEQTLEQIDLTMASIDLAGVSLEPTPSKVPLIEQAMTDASAAVTQTLDDL